MKRAVLDRDGLGSVQLRSFRSVPHSSDALVSSSARAVLGLQRSVGNAAVASLFAKQEKDKGQGGPDQPPKEVTEVAGEEDDQDEVGEQPAPVQQMSPKSERVHAEISGPPTESVGPGEDLSGDDEAEEMEPLREVTPTESVRYNGAAAGSTCLPDDITPADVDWDAVDKGKKWGVKVTTLRTAGQINVKPTPNNPNALTTPNTVNPVDGGNVTDAKGHNYWKFAIKEMKEYHTSNGGKSAYWHSTVASDAHEQAHWDVDWKKNVLPGLWSSANSAIDKITIAKSAAASAVAAKTALKPKVDKKIRKMNSLSSKKWNAVPDDPGKFFANGYLAGQKVLNGLIKRVRAYAKQKKWK